MVPSENGRSLPLPGRYKGFFCCGLTTRTACLAGVRDSSLVILLLGARYGTSLPPANISPTHEEYLEARASKPVLVFVQGGVDREHSQDGFIREVEDWDRGHFRTEFVTPNQLRSQVTRAIHQREIASAVTPVDSVALLEKAIALVTMEDRRWHSSSGAILRLAVAGAPIQQILRPVEIEDNSLSDKILQDALFGSSKILNSTLGTKISNNGDRLILMQENYGSLELNQQGDLLFKLYIPTQSSGFPIIVQEDVELLMAAALKFASDTLDKIDSSQKITRICVAAMVEGGDYLSWKQRAELDPSARSISLGHSIRGESSKPVHQSPPDFPRAALGFDAPEISADLSTLLRRQSMQ